MYQTDDWPALPPLSALVNRVHCMDALELLALLPDASVDAIITDLPYGTTACTWDTIIPFAPMWAAVKRVLKPRGVFVTTANEPFASLLRVSNLEWFKYDWVWHKNRGTNFINMHSQPMKEHDIIIVFGSEIAYFPQLKERSESGKSRANYAYNPSNTGKRQALGGFIDKTTRTYDPDYRLPGSVIEFNVEFGFHPTQKPVALYEYLISTYTLPGELVVDPCCGSGTTGVAARNLKRDYILNDSAAEYVEVTRDRLRNAWDKPRFRASDLTDLPLFEGLAAVSE